MIDVLTAQAPAPDEAGGRAETRATGDATASGSSAWPEISVLVTAASADTMEAWLFAAGALSVTSCEPDGPVEPVLEPLPGETPLWSSLRLTGLFEQGLAAPAVHARLVAAAQELAVELPEYQLAYLPDQTWERSWMADFQPMQFGPRFWIHPSHCQPADSGSLSLRLDPGLAFGTGTHPTTAQCLRWLASDTGDTLRPLAGQQVIDYGCGSGVLGIAAALLGAAGVLAVDIDPQALQATAENARINQVAGRVATASPGGDWPAADLVLANILYQPLQELADTLAALVRPGGELVMAGMLDAQVEPLMLAYTGRFEVRQHGSVDGWALLVARRR